MIHGTATIALAAVGIAGAVMIATLTLPFLRASQQTTSNGSATTTLTAPPTAVNPNPYDCPRVETFGNLSYTYNPCARFPRDFTSASQAFDTLDSPQVQAFIKNAYEYHLVYFQEKAGDPNRVQAIINVTGDQVVAGNWSTGYQISYVGNYLLNVTVGPIGSSFEVTHLSTYQLPDRHTSQDFSAEQQKAIAAATSDSRTVSLMAGESWYVVWVSPFQGNEYFVLPQCPGFNGNSSVVVKSYDVQFNQVDGYRNVQVYVDQDFGVLARTTSNEPRSIQGYGNGLLITDPWIGGYVQPQQFMDCPQ